MKWILTICMAAIMLVSAGCTEFAAGFGTGAVAMEKLKNDAEDAFIVAVNELNAESRRLEEGAAAAKGMVLVKPETLAAFEKVRDRAKEPITWALLASVLTNAFGIGRYIKKPAP